MSPGLTQNLFSKLEEKVSQSAMVAFWVQKSLVLHCVSAYFLETYHANALNPHRRKRPTWKLVENIEDRQGISDIFSIQPLVNIPAALNQVKYF